MVEIVRFGRKTASTSARLAAFRAGQATRNNRLTTLWLVILAFCSSAAIGALALPYVMPGLTPSASAPQLAHVSLQLCTSGRGSNCVVDGDTFRLNNQPIRIADIDTPETRDYGCAAEKALGDRATMRMQQLLNAGPFELQPYERDEDQYGRKLRIVARDGQSLGQTLVNEGLARAWDGSRHSWC